MADPYVMGIIIAYGYFGCIDAGLGTLLVADNDGPPLGPISALNRWYVRRQHRKYMERLSRKYSKEIDTFLVEKARSLERKLKQAPSEEILKQ